MKLNIFQKILLAVYGGLFVYFSIIHVPFKTNSRQNEIEYDTLFSNSSNLETGRLIIIIITLTILTAVLLLLFRNINYSFKSVQIPKKTIRVFSYSFIGLVLLFVTIFSIHKFQSKKEANKIVSKDLIQTVDTAAVVVNTAKSAGVPSYNEVMNCDEEQALEDFKSYMKFYYPDWKIFGKPVIKQMVDCVYRIQFNTINPHIRYEREVIIVQVSINPNTNTYRFDTVRGALY